MYKLGSLIINMSHDWAFEGTGKKLSSLLDGFLFLGTNPKLRFVVTSHLAKCS